MGNPSPAVIRRPAFHKPFLWWRFRNNKFAKPPVKQRHLWQIIVQLTLESVNSASDLVNWGNFDACMNVSDRSDSF
jgi:hypothetical protein